MALSAFSKIQVYEFPAAPRMRMPAAATNRSGFHRLSLAEILSKYAMLGNTNLRALELCGVKPRIEGRKEVRMEFAAKAFTEFGLEVPDRVKDELAAHRFE